VTASDLGIGVSNTYDVLDKLKTQTNAASEVTTLTYDLLGRHACNRRLQNVLYHWARIAIQKDARCRARYEALRARGHSWARALRTIADHLLHVACAMLKTGTLYDSNHRAEATQST
jgi:YD repeat-containing protein